MLHVHVATHSDKSRFTQPSSKYSYLPYQTGFTGGSVCVWNTTNGERLISIIGFGWAVQVSAADGYVSYLVPIFLLRAHLLIFCLYQYVRGGRGGRY